MNTATNKKIGVWFDGTLAHFIDMSNGYVVIETKYACGDHPAGNNKGGLMNNYCTMVIARLQAYDDIYLFGPGNARTELYNIMKADKYFKDKAINA